MEASEAALKNHDDTERAIVEAFKSANRGIPWARRSRHSVRTRPNSAEPSGGHSRDRKFPAGLGFDPAPGDPNETRRRLFRLSVASFTRSGPVVDALGATRSPGGGRRPGRTPA